MLVLGIETTCDETAAAVVRRHEGGHGEILSNVVHSQVADHTPYGGVVPEIAARAHVELVDGIVSRAMEEANVAFADLAGVAAAAGPGLVGGVIVGLTTAKAIALAAARPFVAVNHLEAHALTPRLIARLDFPYCLLLVSGGHTQIVGVHAIDRYERLGTTMDDAIGEAFDKTAKMLGLPYPGGPEVERAAMRGEATRFALPRPMVGRETPDFSLSGLKTAVRLAAQAAAPLAARDVDDLCAAFQQAVVEIVDDRMRTGLSLFQARHGKPKAVVVAGGVAANKAVRAALDRIAADMALRLIIPPSALCTDNGAIVAWAGAERLASGQADELDAAPRPRWPMGEPLRAEVAE